MNISGSKSFKNNVETIASAIKQNIDNDNTLTDTDKAKIKKAIDDTSISSNVPNTFVYWVAVVALSLIAFSIVVGTLLILANGETDFPEFLQTTLATAIGALAGMIIPTPRAE